MSRDWRKRWFRRRSWWPFTQGWTFGDVDEVFREMEELVRGELEELSRRAPGELERERILPDGSRVKEWGPFVYGYSLTMGPEGEPRVREFGNIRPETRMGRPRISLMDRREPLIDVMDSEGEVRVIAELPGVKKEDIGLQGTEDALTVSVESPQRRYYKELELPAPVDHKLAKSTYRNGILEVTLPKKKKEEEGEPIEVE